MAWKVTLEEYWRCPQYPGPFGNHEGHFDTFTSEQTFDTLRDALDYVSNPGSQHDSDTGTCVMDDHLPNGKTYGVQRVLSKRITIEADTFALDEFKKQFVEKE